MATIAWTAEETTKLIDLVIKNEDWIVISQKITKPVQSCQAWFHFLQNTSKTLHSNYLSSLILPTDIWPRVATFLNFHDMLSLMSVNHVIYKRVFNNDVLWQRAFLERFPFYGYLKDENVSYIGENPYYFLLRKLLIGKFLVITNADYYGKPILKNLLVAGWNEKSIDMITISDTLIDLKTAIESNKYDAVVIITNYGWDKDCFDELGNIIKKMIDDGIGVVSCVFCGCSWVETLGGDYKTNNCNPIVPNVYTNNVEGSQWDIKGKMKPTNKDHFVTFNTDKEFDTTISLGTVHPEGTVLATLVSEVDEKEYPLLVELKKWPGTILSVNTRVIEGESWKLVGNGILYVARNI